MNNFNPFCESFEDFAKLYFALEVMLCRNQPDSVRVQVAGQLGAICDRYPQWEDKIDDGYRYYSDIYKSRDPLSPKTVKVLSDIINQREAV